MQSTLDIQAQATTLMPLPLCHQSFQRILSLKPHPSREIHDCIIEQNETTEYPKVPPNVTVVHTEASPKLITSRILTELAYAIRSYLDISHQPAQCSLGCTTDTSARAAH